MLRRAGYANCSVFKPFNKIVVCRSIAGLCMARALDAFFYEFTGIINYRFLINQIARTMSVIL